MTERFRSSQPPGDPKKGPIVTITIRYFEDESLVVDGNSMHDKAWTLKCLESAVDAVRNSIKNGPKTVPGKDTGLILPVRPIIV